MGGEEDGAVVRALVELIDEDRPQRPQAGDHGFVMDDLVPDIDRCAVTLDRLLDHLDGPVHARAKSTGGGKTEGDRARSFRHPADL